MESLTELELHAMAKRRDEAWSRLYAHGRLDVMEWAELAKDLDRIITELTGTSQEF